MSIHGHTITWGAHIGHASHGAGWYQQLKEWWNAHTAARREVRRASLATCWDSQRETFRPLRADAASEMAAAQGALSLTTMLYGISQ